MRRTLTFLLASTLLAPAALAQNATMIAAPQGSTITTLPAQGSVGAAVVIPQPDVHISGPFTTGTPGTSVLQPNDMDRHFDEMDLNHDGVITRDEMIAAAGHHFDMMDLNHDGKVTREEAREAMAQHMGGQPPVPGHPFGSPPVGSTNVIVTQPGMMPPGGGMPMNGMAPAGPTTVIMPQGGAVSVGTPASPPVQFAPMTVSPLPAGQ